MILIIRRIPLAIKPHIPALGRRLRQVDQLALASQPGQRLVDGSTAGQVEELLGRQDFTLTQPGGYRDDVLLFGRESSGVPDAIHAAADARLTIPMRPGLRSLNVAMACAMVVGEALRQTGGVPKPI